MNRLKTLAVTLGVAGAVALGAGNALGQDLILYTASNPKIEKDIMAAFSKAHPEIKVDSVNMSTGPITERAIAEKANPQADVIWMINDIALEQLKDEGVLEPYVPKGTKITEAFREEDGFWHGHNATIMAMAVNTKLPEGEEPPHAHRLGGPDQACLQGSGHHRRGDQVGHRAQHLLHVARCPGLELHR